MGNNTTRGPRNKRDASTYKCIKYFYCAAKLARKKTEFAPPSWVFPLMKIRSIGKFRLAKNKRQRRSSIKRAEKCFSSFRPPRAIIRKAGTGNKQWISRNSIWRELEYDNIKNLFSTDNEFRLSYFSRWGIIKFACAVKEYVNIKRQILYIGKWYGCIFA